MKFRVLAISLGLFIAGIATAQTMTEVINEFNAGVAKLNNQEYDAAISSFNETIVLAEKVGDEASDMKTKAEEQIPATYYRQATVYMKRKQYDNAIPFLEKTVEYATLYVNNEEYKKKAQNYLPPLFAREGNRELKNGNLEASLAFFNKSLELNPNLYKAYQGIGLIHKEQDDLDKMMEAFNKAKAGAEAKGDTKTITEVNSVIDGYYNKLITEEMEMVDPEDNDYSYVLEACENALAANDKNPRAYYHIAMIKNKMIEYDAAVEYALKAIEYETEPVWISAANFELGHAFQNTVEYDKACQALQKVTEEPFLSRAEKKMGNIPGCN